MKPLVGVQVLELARILAGPWAGQCLADLGASVIKVERPVTGDDTRAWGPPFLEEVDGTTGDAAYFHCCNRGKRSIAVDFDTPDGRAVVRKIAAKSDVLLENFRPGSLSRFGFDYESLARTNPGLVYCSITGFGQTGPYAHRAGYDYVIQAMGGIMDLTGEPGRPPQKIGVAVADIFTGVYTVVAIQAALLRRQRTGRGAKIDMALLDTQVGVLANQAMNYLVSRTSPSRLGNAHPNLVPYQVFEASDGPLVVAVGNDRQNLDLCQILGIADHARDNRFRENAGRVRNREAFLAPLAAAIGKWRREELLAAMEKAAIPAGPINSVAEVFNDEQVRYRAMQIGVPNRSHPGGLFPGVRTPVLIDDEPAAAPHAAPRLGEHTNEILAEHGYASDSIAKLRAAGAVG